MNTRTKFLLGALAVVGVGVFGDQGYRRLVEEPAQKREREASKLDKQIKEAEDTIFRSAAAADELLALEQYSLPYDEELARAHYQDWLLTLVEKVDLQQGSVDAGTPVAVSIKDRNTRKPKEVFKRYLFSLRGRGTLRQVTRLLYEFYQGGHLHKIRTMALNPIAGGKQLDVTMGIEALGLTRCEREGELSTAKANRLAFDNLESYETIVRRNLFSQEGVSALRDVMLTAITFDRSGTPGAWFSAGSNAQTYVVHRGESLGITSHHVEVIDIQPQLVLIEVDGDVLRLSLGKTIHETLAASTPASEASTTVVR
ncbi:MAG: hypothetical protein QGG09_21285 [Pirellulaceae bacterium]|jgi:hypothetical protein|nr:hypothetical protein [Pirellulaceae bacterium]HJN08911.1 hypothetical protein [Pirellulaceae bacterium]